MLPSRETEYEPESALDETPGAPSPIPASQPHKWAQRMEETARAWWTVVVLWLDGLGGWLVSLWHRGRSLLARAPRSHDPSEAMFSSIWRRLTLWYCGALALLLLISGIGLYQGTEYALMNPITTTLTSSAQEIAQDWRHQVQYGAPDPSDQPGIHTPSESFGIGSHFNGSDPRSYCPTMPDITQQVPYIVCFTAAGEYIYHPFSIPKPFYMSTSVAQAALNSSSGAATDRVEADNGMGQIQRYALVVQDPTVKNAILGVVMVGMPIQGQLDALHDLLYALLIVGTLTLLGAAVSGFLLAQRAMAPARLAIERQQEFIADASHELRTPLTLLRADAEVLLRGRKRLPPDDAELLEDIVDETAHMSDLTTNLLTLARLDAGSMAVEHDLIDLGDVASQTIRRAQALASERDIRLTNLTQPTSEPALVVGDRALLERAALILVDNAIKYTQAGGAVTVRVARAGSQATLTVSDNGPGVAPEHLKRLSERFYRVDKARSREMGGAGLGLAIARGIVETHKGTLTFASEVGKGLMATLTLPAAAPSV